MDSDQRVERLEQEMMGVKQLNISLEQKMDTVLALLSSNGQSNTPHSQPPASPPIPTHTQATPTPAFRSSLKPSPPLDFDGDKQKGRNFLNQCHIYFRLCPHDFPDDQFRIQWTLSFLKTGRAALFANTIITFETTNQTPRFADWSEFETEFSRLFLPPNPHDTARDKLDTEAYYQGK